MEIEILKCHGSGNDFLLIDEISRNYGFTEEQRRELAIALCRRDSQLGADGILFTMKSDKADARMRVFNADGSEASMCGNGLRCVARYVCELLDLKEAIIETMKADLKVEKRPDIFPEIPTYLVEISPVSFQIRDLPLMLNQETLKDEKISSLSDSLNFTALAVPNPHLIAVCSKDDIRSDLQKEISEQVNGPNELFPDGVNVSFIKPLREESIYVRTFERGVGFTNACGTAMSASTLVSCLQGMNKLERPVDVYNNGGKVQCIAHESNGGYTIDLIGNATYMYRVKAYADPAQPKSFTLGEKAYFEAEAEQYGKLQEHASEVIEEYL
ncbi:diaminopimelate epimerase [Bacillus infantis]|uniref:diaminopimelate epimerase n=1 Tax=Bacillus infantis TaxID=324767 RepID=UPI001CD3634F|nr:diaminopimelate epimerase [Bacillus infantis]MCA1040011.1 diaminopimelate epimerase [Bacillus infantis]